MITLIAAVSRNGIIGKDGSLPWKLKSDINHFKEVTEGHTVIMGRKTWESIPEKFRPLKGRRNIILTNQDDFSPGAEDVEVVHSIAEALLTSANDIEVFIIGGESVYHDAIPYAERLLITHVDVEVEGNRKFPNIERNKWNILSKTERFQDEGDEFPFTITDYSPALRYIELANVRSIEQLRVMREIRKAGHCPLCLENLEKYHTKPIIREGTHWLLTENQWPYSGAKTHLLLILKYHEETVGSISTEANSEFFAILKDLERDGYLPGGGFAMRSGDPLRSGGTIKHLHAQIVSPEIGTPVRIQIGASQRY